MNTIIRNKEGNALFLILIAVALFAALSYAITQSGRGGGNIDKERSALKATEFLNYASQLQTTVERLRLINNCTVAQLSFENSNDGIYDYTNAAAPADQRCHLFEAAGGGMHFYGTIDEAFLDTGKSGNWGYGLPVITSVGIDGVGGYVDAPDHCGWDCAEIVLWFPYVNKNMCQEINAQLGVTSSSNIEPPTISTIHLSTSYDYTGAGTGITADDYWVVDSVSSARIQPRTACVSGANGQADGYVLYKILAER